MIRTNRGLSATRESLTGLEEALLDLTRHRAEYHPATFELIAAPIREEILARRAEIDEYIGMAPANGSGSPNGVRGPILTVTAQLDKKVVLASRSSHVPVAEVSFAPARTLAS